MAIYITGWEAGDLFGDDKIFGQIVNFGNLTLESRPNADWGCSIRGNIRRKTQNVVMGWLFLAVLSKVLAERNVLFLLKLVACREEGEHHLTKERGSCRFFCFTFCRDIGHIWTRIYKIHTYSLNNIFKINTHAVTTQDNRRLSASQQLHVPFLHHIPFSPHRGSHYSNFGDNNILASLNNLISYEYILKAIYTVSNYINGIMLMASFYDLLLLLHIMSVIFIHLLISYFLHFHHCIEFYCLNPHEYTMVESNHSTSAEYLVYFHFLAITVLLCAFLHMLPKKTCSIVFPRHFISYGSGRKKNCILRWLLRKGPFTKVWAGCGETTKDRAAPQG